MSDRQQESSPVPRVLRFDLPIESEEDLRQLRGALLAARATVAAEVQRRGNRLSFGYGTDSAREGMSSEIDHNRRRLELLDRLIEALGSAGDDG